MFVYWLECEGGHIHVAASCPDCSASQDGLLLGTLAVKAEGRIPARCPDCGAVVDYYIEVYDRKLWKLEPVEIVRSVIPRQAVTSARAVAVATGVVSPPADAAQAVPEPLRMERTAGEILASRGK